MQDYYSTGQALNCMWVSYYIFFGSFHYKNGLTNGTLVALYISSQKEKCCLLYHMYCRNRTPSTILTPRKINLIPKPHLPIGGRQVLHMVLLLGSGFNQIYRYMQQLCLRPESVTTYLNNVCMQYSLYKKKALLVSSDKSIPIIYKVKTDY